MRYHYVFQILTITNRKLIVNIYMKSKILYVYTCVDYKL